MIDIALAVGGSCRGETERSSPGSQRVLLSAVVLGLLLLGLELYSSTQEREMKNQHISE